MCVFCAWNACKICRGDCKEIRRKRFKVDRKRKSPLVIFTKFVLIKSVLRQLYVDDLLLACCNIEKSELDFISFSRPTIRTNF